MKRRLQLDYTIPRGRLAPHFAALAEGSALARRCDCGHVAFPPALTCAACGAQEGDWITLSGAACIQFRTDTPDAAWALARFEGADTAALVRLTTPDLTTLRGRLVPPQDHAGLCLALEETEDDD